MSEFTIFEGMTLKIVIAEDKSTWLVSPVSKTQVLKLDLEAGMGHSVNGFLYCNGHALEAAVGQKIHGSCWPLVATLHIFMAMLFNTMVVDLAISECQSQASGQGMP